MVETLQVRQRGTLTLPSTLRKKYGIQPGDTFSLVDLDGMFVLTPMVPMVPLFHWSDLVYHLSFSYNLLYFVLQK